MMNKAETGAKTAGNKAAEKANVVNLPVKADATRTEQVSRFVKDHPVMVIAGGLALGALAAALLPRRNRAYVAKRSSAVADAVTAASLAIAKQVLDRAEHLGGDVRRQSERVGRSTASGFERLADVAVDALGRFNPPPGAQPANLADHLAARAERLKDRLFH